MNKRRQPQRIMMISKAGSWESTFPNYVQHPISVSNMRMTVSVGSHVVIKIKEEAAANALSEYSVDGTIVVTILSCLSNEHISCVLYQNAESLTTISNLPSPILSGSGYGLNELFKSKNTVVVSVDDIIDYAFIFTLGDVEEDVISYYGITHCYLLRFQIDGGVVEDVMGFVKFPCQTVPRVCFHRSHVAKIWHGISVIQDGLWKVMNTESERQVTVVRVPLNVDEVVLDYIAYRCNGIVKKKRINSPGRLRCITMKGLKRKAARARTNLYLLRFETQSQITVLRKIIGDTSIVGIRRRRPKIGFSDKVEFNTVINMIHGIDDDENNQQLTMKRYIYHDSIDFLFDEYETFMTVRYDSYNYNDDGITNENADITNVDFVQDIMAAVVYQSINPRHEIRSNVTVGSLLGRGADQLLEVTSIQNDHAILTYIEPDNLAGTEIVETDFITLSNDIRHYN